MPRSSRLASKPADLTLIRPPQSALRCASSQDSQAFHPSVPSDTTLPHADDRLPSFPSGSLFLRHSTIRLQSQPHHFPSLPASPTLSWLQDQYPLSTSTRAEGLSPSRPAAHTRAPTNCDCAHSPCPSRISPQDPPDARPQTPSLAAPWRQTLQTPHSPQMQGRS